MITEKEKVTLVKLKLIRQSISKQRDAFEVWIKELDHIIKLYDDK